MAKNYNKIPGMDRKKAGLNAQVNIKPGDMKDICCEQCGGQYFRQVTAFKRISALQSPTGKEQIVPIPSFRCDDCGYVNEEFRPIKGKK
jgi:uncharacterized Zn finger protein